MTAYARLRKAARTTLAATAATSIAAGLVLMPAEPAAANRQRQLVVTIDQPGIADFPPIAGAYPRQFTTDDGILTPTECNTPPTASVCDTIPLKVVPPQLGPFDDWFLRVTLSWTPNDVGTTPATGSTRLLELDLYMWDNLQVVNDGETYTRIVRSQTALNPEKVEVIRPSLGDYNLTVSNWNGKNNGYRIKAEILKGDPVDAVFESTEPIPPDLSGDPGGPVTDFSDLSFDFGAPTVDDVGAGLEELFLADDDFGLNLGDGPSDLPAPPVNASSSVALPKPGPASGILMFLWLVLFPLAIAGGVGGFLFRRSSRSEWSFA